MEENKSTDPQFDKETPIERFGLWLAAWSENGSLMHGYLPF